MIVLALRKRNRMVIAYLRITTTLVERLAQEVRNVVGFSSLLEIELILLL